MKDFVLAAALLLSAGAAQAADTSRSAEAVLAFASTQQTQTVIDGRLWRCFGTGCRAQAASNPTSQPIGRECRRVAGKLGELSHYRSGKRTLTADELQACNAGVAKRAPATELAGAR
jgi:hypothetical protein